MKAKTILGIMIICLLTSLQTVWFTNAYDASATQFDHSVSVALYSVADTMTDHAVVEKRSSNYFYVKMNYPVSNQVIDTMILQEFSIRNLGLDYELGVYNAEDDSLIHGAYVKSPYLSTDNVSESELDLCNKDFAVLFPEKQSYLVGKLDIWIYSPLLLIFVSTLFFYLVTKTKPGEDNPNTYRIKLSRTTLNCRNRQLIVDGLTHQLTYKEFKILELLFGRPNQVIERETFLTEVWQKDGFFVERSMDVFISKLRKHIKGDSNLKIENLRSIGYRLNVN